MNKEFVELLDQMKAIHEKKAADYAAATNVYENFERNALISSWFNNDIDKAFVGMIATKLARLSTLLNKKGIPNNESIEDSFLDLTTYCALWGANYKRRTNQQLVNSITHVNPITCFNSVTRQASPVHTWLNGICQGCGMVYQSLDDRYEKPSL